MATTATTVSWTDQPRISVSHSAVQDVVESQGGAAVYRSQGNMNRCVSLSICWRVCSVSIQTATVGLESLTTFCATYVIILTVRVLENIFDNKISTCACIPGFNPGYRLSLQRSTELNGVPN